MEKLASNCPTWGQEDFFLLIQTLPTFWAERILILVVFICWAFLDPKIPDSRFLDLPISRFLDFPIPRFPHGRPAGDGERLRGSSGPQDPRNWGNTVRTLSVQALSGKDQEKLPTTENGVDLGYDND